MSLHDALQSCTDADAQSNLEKHHGLISRCARRYSDDTKRRTGILDVDDLTAIGRVATLEALHLNSEGQRDEQSWIRAMIRYRIKDATRRLGSMTRREVRLYRQRDSGDLDPDTSSEADILARRRFETLSHDIPDPTPTAEQLAIAKQTASNRKRDMMDALGHLSQREREAISWSLRGRNVPQVSRLMRVSESRVCQLKSRAIAKLHDAVSRRADAA